MNEYQIFFFILLPTVLIIMLIVLVLSIQSAKYDDSDKGPDLQDAFEEMNDD